MLKAMWECTLCGWQGKTESLFVDEKGHRVCPNCGERKGLE